MMAFTNYSACIRGRNRRMNSKRILYNIALGVAIAGIGVVACQLLFPNILFKDKANDELVLLFNKLRCGDTKQEVEVILRTGQLRYLSCFTNDIATWVVMTPHQVGASDWQLRIDFDNSKVARLQIRTADSKDIHPGNAPLDRGFASP